MREQKTKKKTPSGGALLAASAAVLFASFADTAVSDDEVDDQVEGKCWAVNACKGTSACKTLTSSCAGQNSCKSNGFLLMSLEECTEFGGDWEAIDPDNPPQRDARG
ncbi:hypothetical protein Q4485_11820 [Granulosicoccaceae sp. 1_MG-2023]|nr:hypothetical protein [Granulosicoccaceae sp. 1_MG-2023]